jgi:hypothetical protein
MPFATYSSHIVLAVEQQEEKKSIFAKSNNRNRNIKVKLTHFSFLAHLM